MFREGNLPIVYALQNGQKECTLLLVEHIPELLEHVFKFAFNISSDLAMVRMSCGLIFLMQNFVGVMMRAIKQCVQ